MKQIFPEYCTEEQTIKLNCLLHQHGILRKSQSNYSLYEILNILPKEITLKGKRGDLTISPVDIAYTSLTAEYRVNIIALSSLTPNKDIFDGAIDIFTFINNHIDEITCN